MRSDFWLGALQSTLLRLQRSGRWPERMGAGEAGLGQQGNVLSECPEATIIPFLVISEFE